MTDGELPPGAIPGRRLGLHAVRDEPAKLGDVLRKVLGSEANEAGPATRAWLERVAAEADEHGGVTLDGDELRAALEQDAGNVTPLRPREDEPPFASELVTDRPPHEWARHPDDKG